jgi:peptidoglycan/LPS O-acetylase OafA/YrhL
MSFRDRRQPRWAVVVLAIGSGLASVFSALSLASDDGAPSVASVFLVVVWAFLSGMSVADLIIPVAPDGD